MVEKRSFGKLRKLPSKRWQASYVGPDLVRHAAPDTFETKMDAESWLVDERRLAARPDWVAPKGRRAAELAGLPPTLAEYAEGWLASRDLRPRTVALYRKLLDVQILPTLGDVRLNGITPTLVRGWHATLGPGAPTQRSHAYSLLRVILGTAVAEQLIERNPCVIRAAGGSRTKHKPTVATLEELAIIHDNMPPHLRLAVLIAAWCGLRQGEVFELRRGDVDLTAGVIMVRRSVGRVPGQGPLVGPPKSDAGVRDVAVPPHLLPAFERHLGEFVPIGKESLLFRGRDSSEQVAPSTLYRHYYPAREAAGRPDLRWHDLRHTGATMAALTGASLAELMSRLGHSTVGAAMKYQHSASNRDQAIAALLSEMAQPTPITSTRSAAR